MQRSHHNPDHTHVYFPKPSENLSCARESDEGRKMGKKDNGDDGEPSVSTIIIMSKKFIFIEI